jgi:hypothetical protein
MFPKIGYIIYICYMFVLDKRSGKELEVEVSPLEDADYRRITKSRYFFDWSKEKGNEVYKLQMIGSNEILGLISIEKIPMEWRIHIRLLTVSKENKGRGKRYENIIGNLITHVAKIAVKEYAEFACISLRPKSLIVQHYIDKYKMKSTGMILSLEVPEIIDLINLYDHEK